jgi:mRNA-degrading endonuclease RelE of RelBE toxin-antitoxin system
MPGDCESGDWRALYTVDTDNQIISIMVIRPRGSAYD